MYKSGPTLHSSRLCLQARASGQAGQDHESAASSGAQPVSSRRMQTPAGPDLQAQPSRAASEHHARAAVFPPLSPTASTGSPSRPPAVSPAALREQGGAEPDEECVVCWAEGPEVVFQPCGHLCVCTGCAEPFLQGLTCPMCRHAISSCVVLTSG